MKQVLKKVVAAMLLCALVVGCIPVTRAEAAVGLSTKTYDMAIAEKVDVSAMITGKSKTATYSYKSNKTSVATVSKKGVVTAKKAGTTKITVSQTKNNKTKKVGVITITVHKASIYMDSDWYFTTQTGCWETYPCQLEYSQFLSFMNPKATYTWESADPELLTITEDGVITHAGLPEGETSKWTDTLSIQETYKGKTRTVGNLGVLVLAPQIDSYNPGESWSWEDGQHVVNLAVGESFAPRDALLWGSAYAYGVVWIDRELTEEEVFEYGDDTDEEGEQDDDSEKALFPVKDEEGIWTGEYIAQKPGTYYVYLVAYNYLTETYDYYIGSIKVVVTE